LLLELAIMLSLLISSWLMDRMGIAAMASSDYIVARLVDN
jgi:hypothetical protein